MSSPYAKRRRISARGPAGASQGSAVFGGSVRRRLRAKRLSSWARSVRRGHGLNSIPERKITIRNLPMTSLYNPATTFGTQYPATWAAVDQFPTIGTGDSNFIGSQIIAKGFSIDLIHTCLDQNVECRFICFMWKPATAPDGTTNWNNPLTGTLSTTGAGFNPWFAAKSDEYVKVLYQKAYRLSGQSVPNTQPSGGTVPGYVLVPARKRIKKFIRLNHRIRPYTDTVQSISSSTVVQNTSWANRIYWCIITNNYTGSDNGIVGNIKFTYTDA